MNYGTRSKRTAEKLKKAVRCVETGKVYNSIKEAAEDVKRTPTTIVHALKGYTKTAGGYHWEYIN
jgi:predicted transcriptional regulator